MSKVKIEGNASGTGTLTIAAPNTNTDRTLNLPDGAGEFVTADSSGDVDITGDLTIDNGSRYKFIGGGTNELELGTYSSSNTSRDVHMSIDSAGNVLVGTTDSGLAGASSGNEGIRLDGNQGQLQISAVSDTLAYFNRQTSDGEIIDFRKDGTSKGYIGVNTGTGSVYFAGQGRGINFTGSNRGVPCNETGTGVDNNMDWGSGTYRFDDIYATNSSIQTSDRNQKQDIEELSEAEQRVAVACKGLLRKYRWIDSVAEKGDDARIHFGIIAQDLQDAFTAEGLDAGRYAMFISSTWWETTETYTDDDGVEQTRTNTYDTAEEAPEGATERTRLGVRYPELLAFIIAAI